MSMKTHCFKCYFYSQKNGSRQGSLASSSSQQSLSQSRQSIQSLGAVDSHSNQSYQSSQVPSYCTLPRQIPGQAAGNSAFHPVTKSAPGTPKTGRAANRMQEHTQQVTRLDLKPGGTIRSLSQPSSPTGSTVTQAMSSIYSMKRDNDAANQGSSVQVLPLGVNTGVSLGKKAVIYSVLKGNFHKMRGSSCVRLRKL